MATITTVCGLCDNDSNPGTPRPQPAIYYCSEDKQHMCETHYTFHQKLLSTSGHNVTCLQPSPGQVSACPHVECIQFYCNAHKILCCIGCRRERHDDCDCKIVQFDDYNPEKIKQLIKCCKHSVRTLKEEKNKTKKKCCSAKGKETAWVDKLTAALNELNRQKEELEQKIEKKVEYVKTAMNSKREEIETKLEALEAGLSNVQESIGDLETLANTDAKHKKIQVFQTMFHAEERLAQCDNLVASSESSCQIAFLKLEHNFEAENYVSGTLQNLQKAVDQVNKVYSEIQKYLIPSHTEIQSTDTETKDSTIVHVTRQTAGSAETNPKEDFETTGRKTLAADRRSGCSGVNADLTCFYKSYETFKLINPEARERYPSLQIQTQCQIKVKTEQDNTAEQCCITGIASLDGDFLIMADYANSCLKLFKKSDGLQDYMKFQATPRDIAKISDTKILVNFPMQKNIQTVKIVECDTNAASSQIRQRQMKIGDLKIHTEAKCCGIAFHDNKIYAATQLPHQIIIFNTHGERQRIIPGDQLFDRATYITVNPLNSLIYISDPSHKSIFGINEEGQKKFSYTVEQPHGVACSESGGMFVADWETGVHKVNAAGTRVKDLRLATCNCPQKLTYEMQPRLLLVTEWQCDIVQAIYLQK